MNVWVNVWRWTRGAVLLALSASVSGCIDDFDDPKGYGAAGGRHINAQPEETLALRELEPVPKVRSAIGLRYGEHVRVVGGPAVLESEAEAAGCSEELAELVECLLTLEDVCSPEDGCQAEVERFLNCTYI